MLAGSGPKSGDVPTHSYATPGGPSTLVTEGCCYA